MKKFLTSLPFRLIVALVIGVIVGYFACVALTKNDGFQLKGDKEAAAMLKGKPCGLESRPDWTVEKKKID